MPVTFTVTVLQTPTGDLYLESKSKCENSTSKEEVFSQILGKLILESVHLTSKAIGCDGMMAVEGASNPDGTMPEGFKTQVEALRRRSGQ